MALIEVEEKFRTYEVLFRYHLNGDLHAHWQKIRMITIDGKSMPDQILPPAPLATAGPEFDAVIAEINLAFLSERDALLIKLSDMTEERDALIAENENLIKSQG